MAIRMEAQLAPWGATIIDPDNHIQLLVLPGSLTGNDRARSANALVDRARGRTHHGVRHLGLVLGALLCLLQVLSEPHWLSAAFGAVVAALFWMAGKAAVGAWFDMTPVRHERVEICLCEIGADTETVRAWIDALRQVTGIIDSLPDTAVELAHQSVAATVAARCRLCDIERSTHVLDGLVSAASRRMWEGMDTGGGTWTP